jgi:hypothetical protein
VTPRMWTCLVATSITNRTYRRRRKIASTWKKSLARKPVRLCAEECAPGGVVPAGRWPACAEDAADGGCAEVVPEPGEFAVHAAVSPGRVLPGQPQCQVAEFLAGWRAPGLVRVGPFALDEPAVPGQQRARGDQAMMAQSGGEQAG